MTERNARPPAMRGSQIPIIKIIRDYTALPAGPYTLFEISLFACDTEDAVLAVRVRMDEDPLICLHARAGGMASFVPAAPTVILDPLHVCIIGADAVAMIAFR